MIINKVFRPLKNLKKPRIKLYNTVALPSLLYGSENRTIKGREKKRSSRNELYEKSSYPWTDYKTHTPTAKELTF